MREFGLGLTGLAIVALLSSGCAGDKAEKPNTIKIENSGERRTAQKRNQLLKLQNKQDSQIASQGLNQESRNQILGLHSEAVKRNLKAVGISNFVEGGEIQVQIEVMLRAEGANADEITRLSCRLVEDVSPNVEESDSSVRKMQKSANCDSRLSVGFVCLDDLCNESMFTLGGIGRSDQPNARVSGAHQTTYFEPDQVMSTGLSEGKTLSADLNQHLQLVNTEILIRGRERAVFQNIAVKSEETDEQLIIQLQEAKPRSLERPMVLPAPLNPDNAQGGYAILGGDRIALNFHDKSVTCDASNSECNTVFSGDFVSGGENASRAGNSELNAALQLLTR